MTAAPPPDALEQARHASRLTHRELWLRYFALGGMNEPLQLEAVLHGVLQTTVHDRNQIAHALNERFTELGRNHPVAYQRPDPITPPPPDPNAAS